MIFISRLFSSVPPFLHGFRALAIFICAAYGVCEYMTLWVITRFRLFFLLVSFKNVTLFKNLFYWFFILSSGHFSYLSECIGRIEADIIAGNKSDCLMCSNVISTSLLNEKLRYSMKFFAKNFCLLRIYKDFRVIQFDISLFTFTLDQ